MGKIIAITNQKGGVGKTTTSINLAAGLAFLGKSILLVDLDPQANTTQGLGARNDIKFSTYEMLLKGAAVSDCIKQIKVPPMDLIPATINLAGSDLEMYNYKEGKEKLLKNRLDEDYKAMEPIRNALLVPLRGSYKMAALAQVEPLMLDAGLTNIKPDDAPFRALPLVNNAVPEQLYGRAAVRFTARGSYQAAISFLLKLERDLPLVSLQALEITAQQDPDNQAIMFILEWPTLGKKTTNEGKVAKK